MLHHILIFAAGLIIGGGLIYAFRGKVEKTKKALASELEAAKMQIEALKKRL